MALQQKITPHLWFEADAEEAVAFYCSIFKDSRIVTRSRRGECGPGPHGEVMAIAFRLNGQDFVAIDGGPHFEFSEAVSFSIGCETQAELDDYWSKLLAGGGQEQSYGWLKDASVFPGRSTMPACRT